MASSLGLEFHTQISPEVISVDCSHRIAVDVKGDTHSENSLPALAADDNRVRLAVIAKNSALWSSMCYNLSGNSVKNPRSSAKAMTWMVRFTEDGITPLRLDAAALGESTKIL